jgi:hypothetical protein
MHKGGIMNRSVSMTIAITCLLLIIIFLTVSLVIVERQYDDCQFEVAHNKTKLSRLQELSDYVLILEQILTPRQLAELKAANTMILHEKYREYERVEQPIITKKEIDG